jgi:hypothetical protein
MNCHNTWYHDELLLANLNLIHINSPWVSTFSAPSIYCGIFWGRHILSVNLEYGFELLKYNKIQRKFPGYSPYAKTLPPTERHFGTESLHVVLEAPKLRTNEPSTWLQHCSFLEPTVMYRGIRASLQSSLSLIMVGSLSAYCRFWSGNVCTEHSRSCPSTLLQNGIEEMSVFGYFTTSTLTMCRSSAGWGGILFWIHSKWPVISLYL